MLSRFAFLLPQCAAALPVILAFSVYCVAASEPASVVESALELIDPLESNWALGDLDGDHKTDVVLSEYIGHRNSDYLYRIELKLSRREEGSGSFSIANTDTLGL